MFDDVQEILTQLRTIFDLIINFQTIHDNMYCAAKDELEARQKYENSKLTSEDRVSLLLIAVINFLLFMALFITRIKLMQSLIHMNAL